MPEPDAIAAAIATVYPDLTQQEACEIAGRVRGFAKGKLRRRDPFLAELRRLREAAGYTQSQVANAMNVSWSKIVRAESGANPLSHADLVFMLNMYRATDDERDRLLGGAVKRRDAGRT